MLLFPHRDRPWFSSDCRRRQFCQLPMTGSLARDTRLQSAQVDRECMMAQSGQALAAEFEKRVIRSTAAHQSLV